MIKINPLSTTFFKALKVLILFFAGSMSFALHAQTSADLERAQRARDQALQLEQQRLERERQQFLDRRPFIQLEPLPLAPKPVIPKLPADKTCQKIDTIDLLGGDIFSQSTFEPVVSRYLDKCLTTGDVEKLMADLYKIYIDRGYIAVRIFLTNQDLSKGKLELRILEGRVSEIRIDDGGSGSISKANTFPGVVGKPLNLRDIEQGLEQINRLGSNQATMSVSPGAAPGDSIVTITNRPTAPQRLTLSTDNLGAVTTGKNVVSANASLDNPLGLNDFVSLNRTQSVTSDQNRQRSESTGFNYAIPFGYTSVSLGYNQSESLSVIKLASGNELLSKGENTNQFFKLDRMMYRDQKLKWSLASTLTQKESANYLGAIRLSTSSRKLTVLDLDSNVTVRADQGTTWGMNVGLSRGLSILGAKQDSDDVADGAPRAQFSKVKFGLTVDTPLKLLGRTVNLNSSLTGQYAIDSLYGSEQFAIGSFYTVRGLTRNMFVGDHGVLLRNELSTRINTNLFGKQIGFKPYVAFDAGKTWQRTDFGTDGSLTGGAMGLTASIGKINLELVASKPLYQPSVFSTKEGGSFNFKLSGAL